MDSGPELERIFREAAGLWNAHRFFECHDKLEEAWRLVKHEKKAEPARDPRRDFYHGLILYAAAYVHWSRGNALGVARKLADARASFQKATDSAHGIDLHAFRPLVESDLERGARGDPFDPTRVPPLRP